LLKSLYAITVESLIGRRVYPVGVYL